MIRGLLSSRAAAGLWPLLTVLESIFLIALERLIDMEARAAEHIRATISYYGLPRIGKYQQGEIAVLVTILAGLWPPLPFSHTYAWSTYR
jgi:hypothetical protein